MLLAAACALPILLFYLLLKFAVNSPQWDEWAVALLVIKLDTHSLVFGDLWAQHNEHRMLVPYSIMLLLAHGGWNIIREVLFSLFLVVLTQILLYSLVVRTIPQMTCALAFLIGSLFLYGMVQYENWLWGFQIAWFLTALLLFVTVWLLFAYPLSTLAFWLALLACVAASFTMASGLNLWIVGLVLLVGNRLSRVRQKIIVWLLASVVTTVIYFFNWSPAGLQSHPTFMLTHPVEFLAYLFAYFGSPLAAWGGLTASVILGVCGLLLFGYFASVQLTDPTHGLKNPWLAVGLFSILCALMTDVGRLAFGIDQALASRYTTFSDLLWVSIIGLSFGFPRVVIISQRKRRAAAVTAVLLFAFFYYKASSVGFAEMRTVHIQDLASMNALRDYATVSDETMKVVFPDVKAVRTWANELQVLRDGPFHP